jgi:signal transduction histidine kinase/DNA-binding NarL/FixJ family response regulator
MLEASNATVLVIDDEEMVRDNIEEILTPARANPGNDAVNQAASILFDVAPKLAPAAGRGNTPKFTVHKAANGMEGVEMVKRSVEDGKPYAVIFLDMRMPGWDGMETAVQIRKYDTKAEIIFVTAFSDRSIDDIVAKAGQNVGYHCKPYAAEEITQIATKAVSDYNKLRNLEKLIEAISSISIDENQLTSLLSNILDQLATYVETDMALLGRLHDDQVYEKLFSIGPIEERINMDELISIIKSASVEDGEVIQADDVVLARLDHYTIFAVLKQHEKLKTEKLYLLKLFVLNAAKAIRNAELREKLLQKEKLSAIGNAVSMMMHDLRSPIKNIKSLTGLARTENVKDQWLDMIDQCAEQASEIFEDFLDFINAAPPKKMPVSIAKIVKEGVELAKARNAGDNVQIATDIPVDLTITGDESKLKRVIMNLVNNAVEVLLTKKVPNGTVAISARQNSSGNEVHLVIRDNGPGIPADIVNNLFEPFVTLNKTGGTGLGLAIVKQYITAHGGSVIVENANGAVFHLSLPV